MCAETKPEKPVRPSANDNVPTRPCANSVGPTRPLVIRSRMNETAEKPASSVRSTSKNAAILGPDGPSRISRVSLSWSTGASRAPNRVPL